MKIAAFLSIFLTCFPIICFAKDELVMHKEFMYWESTKSDSACGQLIYIEFGRDVPDLREEPCGSINGKYSLTLAGPPGTTLTLFGNYNYDKENGIISDIKVLEFNADTRVFNLKFQETKSKPKSGSKSNIERLLKQ